jgi:hypothetical protein
MIEWLKKRIKEKNMKLVLAKAPMALEVTKGDIAGAKQKDPGNCAFACAVKRGYGANAAYFMRTTAYIEFEDRVLQYDMPQAMQKEIVAFDRAKAMEPGVYRLSPVRPARRPEGKPHARALRKKAKRRTAKRATAIAEGKRVRAAKPKREHHPVANIRTMAYSAE